MAIFSDMGFFSSPTVTYFKKKLGTLITHIPVLFCLMDRAVKGVGGSGLAADRLGRMQ